jgi:hypothetical protein
LKDEAQHFQEEADAHDSLDEQFAALGIQPDAPVELAEQLEPFYLWPQNLDAWRLFMAVQTQWRGGMQRDGLDYAGVQLVIGQARAWRKHRRQRLAEVQLMELTCLAEWRKQAEQRR